MLGIPSNNYVEYKEIKGVKVSDVSECFLLAIGQAGPPVAIFLMKDGSVEWFDIEEAVNNSDFNSEGKMENVTGVVRILNVGAGSKSGESGGWIDIIGVKEDGTFYNLGVEIRK